MYNLDSQFNFYSEEGLYKLGLWLRQKVLACDEKMKDSEECLRVCGFSEEVLCREWEAQIKGQTKPLPHKSFTHLSYMTGAETNRDAIQAHANDLRKRLADPTSESWEMATVELELEAALKSLCKAHLKVTKKEDVLGVNAKNQLWHLINRSLSWTVWNACIANSAVSSKSTNILKIQCNAGIPESQNLLADTIDFAMTWTLIQQRKVPRNSVALLKIEMECLFTLDVDDDIWLDMGIGYEEERDDTVPPFWLCNDKVQAGIRAMNNRDCCIEEQAWLLKERSALQLWFNEEWRIVNAAIEHMSDAAVQYGTSVEFEET
ncbi:hypothetical protein BT96DRAFT_946305 [Gymnopus androsaceus JB14]|uniref:Uncharacterized protein n=1 Tax=Gymnopus androsaceus JB14 TaxID=1447944 RepID=A0A6A4GXM7_9AGAR|nr:hypothetical protein BT96DRAFT_946305 [Gymnopus androsaceus JB14]